jgi:hypothetical protein
MTTLAEAIQPGDVLAVRTTGLPGVMIRFGAALQDKPNLDNHIAIAHHQNGDTWRGIEARPGGVAWVDLAPYLENKYTVTNVGQPKTPIQRDFVCKVIEQMLKTSYDWEAIALDALTDLHIPDMWAEQWHGHTPDHVVCSSLAAWAYLRAALNRPMPTDPAHVQPADWTQFILQNGYQNLPGAVG